MLIDFCGAEYEARLTLGVLDRFEREFGRPYQDIYSPRPDRPLTLAEQRFLITESILQASPEQQRRSLLKAFAETDAGVVFELSATLIGLVAETIPDEDDAGN